MYKGCLQKSGILLSLKVFLRNPKRTGDPEKIKNPRKSPEKWTFLSFAFYNAPSLHTANVFSVLLFLGSMFETFSGANFCFWVSWLVLCFSIVFCLGFCSIFWFPSRQVCCFGEFVLCLFGFPSSSPFCFCFCFFQARKLRVNRTHPTPHSVFFFLFLCPRRTGLISRFGRASFLAFCMSGCHSGPRAFWRFLGFSRYCGAPQVLFHTHFCLFPVPAFFKRDGPRGPEWSARGIARAHWRMPRVAPRIPRNSPGELRD